MPRELSNYHCHVSEARARAVFENNDQSTWVAVVPRVSWHRSCVVYSACLKALIHEQFGPCA